MNSLQTISLESNSRIKINFAGGDLSSDAGLLLFKEFLYKNGVVKLINRLFKTAEDCRKRGIMSGFRIAEQMQKAYTRE